MGGDLSAGDVLDPAGVVTDQDTTSSKKHRMLSTIADPLDIFGERAEDTKEEVSDIINRAAQEAFESAEERYGQIKKLQKPFVEYGKQATEKDVTKPYSQQYQETLEEQGGALNRSLAARGLYDSSYAGEQLSNLALGAAQEEIARQHEDRLNKLKIGQMAAGTAGRGGAQFAGSAGKIGSQKGQGIQNAFQGFGAQRKASLASTGNMAQNFGKMMGNM